jgi:hypothetical protein
MRSRLRKKNRSHISLLDRVVESRRKEVMISPPAIKRSFEGNRVTDRLQKPVGIGPLFLLFLTWIVMLVIIWGAFQEIMSLGAPNQPQKSVLQVEQRAFLELLGALVIGGVGLSLVLTPALKRQPKPGSETAIETTLKALETSKE